MIQYYLFQNPCLRGSLEVTGTIVSYKSDRGFGFITTLDGSVFFHISEWKYNEMPRIGMKVSFDKAYGDKGYFAKNVTFLGEEKLVVPNSRKFVDVFGEKIKIRDIINYNYGLYFVEYYKYSDRPHLKDLSEKLSEKQINNLYDAVKKVEETGNNQYDEKFLFGLVSYRDYEVHWHISIETIHNNYESWGSTFDVRKGDNDEIKVNLREKGPDVCKLGKELDEILTIDR